MLLMRNGKNVLLLSAQHYWSRLDENYSVGKTNEIRTEQFWFDEETTSPPNENDEVVEERWNYQKKDGGPDLRYHDNFLLYTIRYYGVEIKLSDGVEWNIGAYTEPECEKVEELIKLCFGTSPVDSIDEQVTEYSAERAWYEILNVQPNASKAEIKAARDKLARQFHPDRLQSVDGLSPEIEQFATGKLAEINAAYDRAISSLK